MSIKLGIIIPTYNSLDTLKVLVKNIRDYTEDYNLYVIEDGQRKMTINWLKKQKDIKSIFNEENKGVAVSWNIGLKAAEKDGCTHFAVFNDDIEIPAGWWDLCQTGFDRDGVHMVCQRKGLKPIMTGYFFIIDQFCLDNVGYFDENIRPFMVEDIDYEIRYKDKGYKIAMANIGVFHHQSRTINKLLNKKKNEVKSICSKNWDYVREKHGNDKIKKYI